MLKSILSRSLTPRQQAAGLSLEEPDDHHVLLCHEDGRVIKKWYVTDGHPTIIDIQEAGDRELERMEGIPFDVEDFENRYGERP